jgi:hypothetical protein
MSKLYSSEGYLCIMKDHEEKKSHSSYYHFYPPPCYSADKNKICSITISGICLFFHKAVAYHPALRIVIKKFYFYFN